MNPTTQKFSLLVETTHNNHSDVVERLWEKVVAARRGTKNDALAWRSEVHAEFGAGDDDDDDDADVPDHSDEELDPWWSQQD